MSEARLCYWSVADGKYADMATTMVRSARSVGVAEDFHIWSDRAVTGAITHAAGLFDKAHYLFKLRFLRDAVSRLDYDYFVFLDADNYFVRHPGNLLRALRGAPIHVTLESDCTSPRNRRPDWWGCPLPEYVRLMRACGVHSRSIFNTNAGFWIVHHDAVETLVSLAFSFWEYCRDRGHLFTEEPPLAYAGHLLTGNPYGHTLGHGDSLWASDWTGVYRNRLPDGEPWEFEDYMSGERRLVDPAIVHCMRSKHLLCEQAREQEASRIASG